MLGYIIGFLVLTVITTYFFGTTLGMSALIVGGLGAVIWAVNHFHLLKKGGSPSHGGGRKGVFGFIRVFLITYIITCILMMAANWLIGVAPFKAFQTLKVVGWNIAGWPHDIPRPVVLWYLCLLVVVGMSLLAAYGQWEYVRKFVLVAIPLFFLSIYLPTFFTQFTPSKVDPATGEVVSDYPAADKNMTRDGWFETLTCAAWRPTGGTKRPKVPLIGWQCIDETASFDDTPKPPVKKVKQAKKRENKASNPVYTVASVTKVGKVSRMHHYSPATGCTTVTFTTHDFNYFLVGEGKVCVYPPTGAPYLDWPGNRVNTHRGPGEWTFCKTEDSPDAIGVEAWE